MAESPRGNLKGRVIKVKLQDSVSVSSGGRDRPRSRSSGGGSKSSGAGIEATVQTPSPPPKVDTSQQTRRIIRQQQRRGSGVSDDRTHQEFNRDEFIENAKQVGRGVIEEGKNFLFGGIQSELSRGSGVIRTGSGKVIAVTPEQQKALSTIEKQVTKNTVSEKIFGGRFSEIDLRDPKTQGQLLGLGLLLAVPVGGKGVGKVKTGIQTKAQESKIGKIEKKLGLPGQTEKVGEDVFISGGGVESRPQSIFITKFKEGKIQELTPSGEVKTLSPKDVTIFGKLDKTTQKDLGARQEGNFRFTSSLKTGQERRTLQKGIFEGEVQEFAKVKTTDIKNILSERPERILSDIKKPPGIFAQTKAEKLEPRFSSGRNVDKPSTPFDTSVTSSSGKTQTFTKEQTKLIKQKVKPEIPTLQKESGLKATVFPIPQQRQDQSVSQVLKFPPQSKPPSSKTSFGVFPVITPVVDISPSRKLDSLTPSKLKIRETIKLDLRKGQTTTPDTGLRIRDDVTFRQDQRQRPKPKLGTPDFPPPPTLVPPPEVPPPPPGPPRTFLLVPPPPRFGGGGGDPDFRIHNRRKPFVGNTLETKVVGIFNKPEINVGRTRTFAQKKGKQKKRPRVFGGGNAINITGNGSKVKIF